VPVELAADDTSHIRQVLLHRAVGPAQMLAQELKAREEAHLTHRPALNPISIQIAQQLERPVDMFERCVRSRQLQLELRRQKKEEQEKREMEECTFKPVTGSAALSAWRNFQQERLESAMNEDGEAATFDLVQSRDVLRRLAAKVAQASVDETSAAASVASVGYRYVSAGYSSADGDSWSAAPRTFSGASSGASSAYVDA
jgi:hypothetical protein